MTWIARDDITGLVLSGGPGTRMKGADKGLQNMQGMPMALLTLLRLQLQLGKTMISANRNLSAYEAMGVPVWPDSMEGYLGPMAGLLSGLEHAETGWLLSVPCDVPFFPFDLVDRMVASVIDKEASIGIAAVHDGAQWCARPEFCLMRTDLVEGLVEFIRGGDFDMERWALRQDAILVPFDDLAAFREVSDTQDLRALQSRVATV